MSEKLFPPGTFVKMFCLACLKDKVPFEELPGLQVGVGRTKEGGVLTLVVACDHHGKVVIAIPIPAEYAQKIVDDIPTHVIADSQEKTPPPRRKGVESVH